MYMKGLGIEKNYEKAVKYFELAFFNNNFDSLYFLGSIHSTGDICDLNISKSIIYFKESAKRHDFNSKELCNNYYYHSNNDLGLLYIIYLIDIEKAQIYLHCQFRSHLHI